MIYIPESKDGKNKVVFVTDTAYRVERPSPYRGEWRLYFPIGNRWIALIFTSKERLDAMHSNLKHASVMTLAFQEDPMTACPDCNDGLSRRLVNLRYDFSHLNDVPYTWATKEEMVEVLL